MKVCLRYKEIGTIGITEELYIQSLFDWIDDIYDRDVSERPHFVILPMGDEYNVMINKYIYDKYGKFGINNIVVGSWYNLFYYSAPSDAFRNEYNFALTPIMKTEETALSSIELFHNRMKLRRWFILGDYITIDYTHACAQGIVDNYRTITGEKMILLEKRCESQRMNVSAPSCENFLDCQENEECVYPIVDTNKKNEFEIVKEMKKWLNLVKALDTDILLLNVDSNLSQYLVLLKEMSYSPKVIMGMTRSYTVIQPRLVDFDNTYLYYASAFSEGQGYGDKSIPGYFGATEDFITYVNENSAEYLHSSLFTDTESVDLAGDYEYIARGSLIGITLQRVVEISTTYLHLDYENDNTFFTSYTVKSIKDVLNYDFEVCYEDDGSYSSVCLQSTNCKSGCTHWQNFFGKVAISENGMNNDLTGNIIQIQSYENYTYPYVVSPSNSPICNKNNKICSKINDYKDCTCNYLEPSWSWIESEIDKYFIDDLNLSLFYVFSSIYDVIIIIIFIFYYKNQRKLKLYKIPSSYSLWFIAPILISLKLFNMFRRPTLFSCSLYSWINNMFMILLALVPYYCHLEIMEEECFSENIKSKLIQLSFIAISALIQLIVTPVECNKVSMTEGIKLVYYYKCNNNNNGLSTSAFIGILLFEQLFFLLKPKVKRTRIVLYCQLYLLYIF